MVLVPYQSPPAKKDRKLTLKPLIVERTQLQLLKPATFEILQKEPYVQAVFLYAFISLKDESGEEEDSRLDERQLEAHILKGYKHLSHRQRVEMSLHYRDMLLNDHKFRNKVFFRAQYGSPMISQNQEHGPDAKMGELFAVDRKESNTHQEIFQLSNVARTLDPKTSNIT